MNDASTLLCPDCGGDMMGCSGEGQGSLLVWMCRSCGSNFVFDDKYELKPYLMEIYYPECPGCGNGMVAGREPAAGMSTRWICNVCGEEINI